MSDQHHGPVPITVFGHATLEVCLLKGCGAKVDSARSTAKLRQMFDILFGTRVVVRHFDLARPEMSERFADVVQGARDRNLPFPLIAIGSDIVFAGPVSVETVLRKLSEYLAES